MIIARKEDLIALGCQMNRCKLRSLDVIAGCAALMVGGIALAQTPPLPLPLSPEIVAPNDRPFSGTIRLGVDATDVTRHIFRVTETIPVQGGPPTLFYPKWVPAAPSPRLRIDGL